MEIHCLELLAGDLRAQREFYTNTLGLTVFEDASCLLSLRAGRSLLNLRQAADGWEGFYHFAFNIPEDRFREAKEWLSERVALITDQKGEDEFRSEQWNSHSIYFYDPAGNILEFIARHTLPEHSDAPFDERSILSVSEIGLVCDDVQEMVGSLKLGMGISPYKGPGSDTFAAVGDEHGLFIIVKRGRIWLPDTGKAAVVAQLKAVVSTSTQTSYQLSGPPYEVAVELP